MRVGASEPETRDRSLLGRISRHIFWRGTPEADVTTDNPRWIGLAMFFVVILGYLLQQCLTQPRFVTSGDMWAEMATNYYPAVQANPVGSLLATDAGYIPLPQRIIALLGWSLHLPAQAFPYFFTFSAVILTGAMLGTFCLSPFRRVIQSDWLRLLLVLAVLSVADFETRTFINFTYLSAFFVSVVACHALVTRGRELPWFAWLIPFLMLSKPATLLSLPIVIVAAFFCTRRFQIVAVISVVVAALQAVRLAVSAGAGGSLLDAGVSLSLPERGVLVGKYGLAFLGKALLGPTHLEHLVPLLIGAGAVVVLGVVGGIIFFPSRSWSLVLAGILLVFGNSALVVFAFGAVFGADLSMVSSGLFDRRTIVLVIGGMCVVVGGAAVVGDTLSRKLADSRGRRLAVRPVGLLAVVLFVGLFFSAGWADYAVQVNAARTPPSVGVSNWATRSAELDGPHAKNLCIAVDPFGWAAGPTCTQLAIQGLGSAAFVRSADVDPLGEMRFPAPLAVGSGQLQSISILVKSAAARPAQGVFSGTILLSDGSRVLVKTVKLITPSAGVVQLDLPGMGMRRVLALKLTISANALIGVPVTTPTSPFIGWLGRSESDGPAAEVEVPPGAAR